ncbi:MAG TPA: hypothetical protein VGT43_07860, partial [Burkholderiales bacterium]|nr:hypothetical protein [Burkholderiales bacterium]
VDMPRERELHQDAVDRGIPVQGTHFFENNRFCNILLELVQLGMHADLGGGQGLVADVDARGSIIAGEDYREARPYSALHKRVDPQLHLGAKPRRERFSVENPGCHGGRAV